MKTKVWYTSDTHFRHKNILKYCPDRYKLWQTVEEMDEGLIERWNSKINPHDIVIHVGDVGFGDFIDLAGQLNGNIKLIVGNHDYKSVKRLEKYLKWEIFSDQIIIDHESATVLCHYPIKDWPMKYHGYIHLHGHSHGRSNGYDINAVDVGVDSWDYYPVMLNQIRDVIESRKN